MKIFAKSKLMVISSLVLGTVLFSSCAETYYPYSDDYYGDDYGYYGGGYYGRPYGGYGFGYYGFYPGYYYSPAYYGYYGWGGYYDYYPAYRYRRSNDPYVIRDRQNAPRRNMQATTSRGANSAYRVERGNTSRSRTYSTPQRSNSAPVRSYSPSAGSRMSSGSMMGGSSRMSSGSMGGGTSRGSSGSFGGGSRSGGRTR